MNDDEINRRIQELDERARAKRKAVDDKFARELRKEVKKNYDRIMRRENLNAKAPPDIDTAYEEVARVNEFARICRSRPQEVRGWLKEYEILNQQPTTERVRLSFPAVYWEFLNVLSQHKDIDLGDTARIRKLLLPEKGDHLARGLKVLGGVSNAGKGRRGFRGPVRRAVESICKDLHQNRLDVSPQAVLDILNGDDGLASDLFDAGEIDIRIQEVVSKSAEIRYITRNGVEDKFTFKTLSNLISKYRNSGS